MSLPNSCIVPIPQTPQKFARFKGKQFDVVFDGDDHVDRWESAEGGKALWQQYFDGKAANFGAVGDHIENILWRLNLGQLDGMSPRVVVLMAGASNLAENSAEEISEGIQKLALAYHRCCPTAKIVLMGIPPKKVAITDNQRPKVVEINRRVSEWCVSNHMVFLDLPSEMLGQEGSFIDGFQSDNGHLSAQAYEVWFSRLQPILDQVLGKRWRQKEKEGDATIHVNPKTSSAAPALESMPIRFDESPFVLLRDAKLIRDFEGVPAFHKDIITKGRIATASTDSRHALSSTRLFSVAIRDRLFRHYFHFMETFLVLFSAQRECFPRARLEKIYFGEFSWDNSAQANVQRKLFSIVYPDVEIIGRLVPEMSFKDGLFVDRSLTRTRLNKMIEPSLGLIYKWFPELREIVYRALEIQERKQKVGGRLKILYVRRPPTRTLTPAVEQSLFQLISTWGNVRTVEFETLSWEDQVREVANSDVLIGVHGNNLTNLLWLPPHAMVVELLPPKARAYDYQMLADVAGLDYFGIDDGVVFRSRDRSFFPTGNFATGIDRLPKEEITFAFNQYIKNAVSGTSGTNDLLREEFKQNPDGDFHIHDKGIESPMVGALKCAFEKARRCEGKLTSGVLSMEGFSGRKYRYLINSLVEKSKNARYLEIGSYFGSTFCAAIQGNSVTAVAIDNWSGFGGPIRGFLQNLSSVSTKDTKVNLLSEDFRKVQYDHIGPFNILFFDGPHDYKDHLEALPLTWKAMDQEFVYIVDDWNWDFVRNGTLDSFRSLSMEILYQLEIRTSPDPQRTKRGKDSFWHNGYFLAVIRKN
jgi:lysophospholipase L1-like esterase